MPSSDNREYKHIFVPYEGIDPERYIIVHYRLIPCEGQSVRETAAKLAILTSLGTMNRLPYEDASARIEMSARVLSAENDGKMIVAFPIDFSFR